MRGQPVCSRGCRMVPLLPDLWLCDHAAYGRMVDLKGAVSEGRRMLAQVGGYQALRDRLDKEAERQKKLRQAERESRPKLDVRHGV